jgi:diadenosine tetraphosphate (Ap4A) HIT family hydrolase
MTDVGHELIAMPTVGMLTADHTLLLPRQHVTSCAALTARVRRNVLSTCHRLSTLVNSDLLLFEHGMLAATAGGCGISHAHLHAMTAPPGIPELPDESKRWISLPVDDPFEAAWRVGDPNGGYLLWGTVRADGTQLLFARPAPAHLPSQYLRQRLAVILTSDQWDWRLIDDGGALAAHASRLKALCR